jgi:hypothetical protein
LQQFESVDFSFPFTLSPSAPIGTELLFLLQLNAGAYIRTDTLRKTFLGNGGGLALLYENQSDNFNGWEGNFELTTEAFVSPPSSFTDSPNGFYLPDAYAVIYFENTIAIPGDAAYAQLRFFAQWDIEEDVDYAQVFVMDENFNATPLCGIYSEASAGSFQPENQPLYDGLQLDWVEEKINLSAYIGQSIRIGFLFQADNFNERDGFYFDDLSIEYADSVSAAPVVHSLEDFRLRQNQPNPASNATVIFWENENKIIGEANLLVFNALGETVCERAVNLKTENRCRLDTRTWPPGIYAYLLRTSEGQTRPVKMTVMH